MTKLRLIGLLAAAVLLGLVGCDSPSTERASDRTPGVGPDGLLPNRVMPTRFNETS